MKFPGIKLAGVTSRYHGAVSLALLIVWVAVYAETLVDMVGVWSTSNTYQYGFIIVPISLWCVWNLRDTIRSTLRCSPVSFALLPAILSLIPAGIWLVGGAAEVALFQHFGAILSLQLLLWSVLGYALAKVLWFPILYLSFCVPAGEQLIPWLQLITADMSVFGLKLSGIPVYREGLYITIPGGIFEVAEACSGIRFLIASVALGFLFAYINFHRWWKWLLFIVFSFVFPIIANAIRAYGIVLVGYLSDMSVAVGADHLIYGGVFFSIVLVVIFWVASKFSDSSHQPTKGRHFEEPSVEEGHSKEYIETESNTLSVNAKSLSPVVLLVAGLSLSVYEKSILDGPLALTDMPRHTMPDGLARLESPVLGIRFEGADSTKRAFDPQSGDIYFRARYQIVPGGRELVSSNNAFYEQGRWTLVSQSTIRLGLQGGKQIDAKTLSLVDINSRQIRLVYWYCLNTYCSSAPVAIKLRTAWYRLQKISPVGTVYIVATTDQERQTLVELSEAWLALEYGAPDPALRLTNSEGGE